jgi:hypothetical protein
MRSLGAFLELATRTLRDAEVSWMLSGSIASSHYGAPRATQDVDLVVELDEAAALRIVRSFLDDGLYASEDAAREAVAVGGQFNVIDPSSGWKLDLICRKDRPFSRAEFDRRRPALVLGTPTDIVTPEDLVLAKLEWAKLSDSELQLRDVVAVLSAREEDFEFAYVDSWVDDLSVRPQWHRVLAAAGLEGRLERD